MPAGIHHTAIKVLDLEAAERFYVGLLGLRLVRRWPRDAAAGGGDRSLWVDCGDGSFVALERATAGAAADADARASASDAPGHHMIAFRIARDERPAWEARLAEAGVEVTHRTAFTLYFRDPEGNRLGLSHHPEPWPR